ncbi:MAG: methyltransferase domain-containing protein [Nitrososphaeraceae archaeon]
MKPKSILDIGTGFGKYGVLCREYLELWDGRQKYEFTRRIDGVEVFGKYITPLHKFVYNNIFSEDIVKLIDRLDFKYELVLLIDVLEHYKDQGKWLLETILSKSTGILISTPKNPSPQKDAFDNICETHRSRWTKDELSKIANCNFTNDNISFIIYITKDKNSLNKLQNGLKLLSMTRNKSLLKSLQKNFSSMIIIHKIYQYIKK